MNEELKINEPVEQEGDLLKIDLWVILTTIRRKLWLLIIIPLITFLIGAVFAKTLIKNKWSARAMLFRQNKSSVVQKDVPHLYESLDINTIVETIRTRNNIKTLKARLDQEVSVDDLYKMTKVEKHRKNNIINLFATHSDPKIAVTVVNNLAEVFMQEYVRLRNNAAEKILKTYEQNLVNIENKITAMQKELKRLLDENMVISIEDELGMKFEQLKEAEVLLMDSKVKDTALVIRIESLSKSIQKMNPEVQLSYVVSSSSQKELLRLEEEFSQLKLKYTDANPKVISLKAKIEKLKKITKGDEKGEKIPDQIVYGKNELRQQMEISLVEAGVELEAVRSNQLKLNDSVNRLKRELKRLKTLKDDYDRKLSKLNVEEDMLKKVKRIISVSKIAISSNVSDIEILEAAELPKYPDASKRKLLAGVAGIAGFVLVAAVVLLMELLDFSVKSSFDLVNFLQIEKSVVVPDDHKVKVNIWKVFHRLYEIVGSDRDTCCFIAVTSDEHDDGKSYVCDHLVKILGTLEKRVLYIQTDDEDNLTENTQNLRAFIQNYSDMEKLLVSKFVHRIVISPDENEEIRPVLKEEVNLLIEHFSKDYDYIFWECEPLRKERELYATISEISTYRMIVTKFRSTNRFVLRDHLKYLRSAGTDNFIGVLNLVPKAYYRGEKV